MSADTVTEDGSYHVPKKELVTCRQLMWERQRLKIAKSLPEADARGREFQGCRARTADAALEQAGFSW